jgi:Phosphotransferase enzyme family
LIPADWAGEAGRVLREDAGIDLVTITPTSRGESGAAFWITDRAGTVMLVKIAHGPAHDAMRNLGGLVAMTGLLRERGYPAPRIQATGQAGGLAFWVQERLPGVALTGDRTEPRRRVLGSLLPGLIRLNDARPGLFRRRSAHAPVVPPGLHPVAADRHRAPPRGVGLAVIDQEQVAFAVRARA